MASAAARMGRRVVAPQRSPVAGRNGRRRRSRAAAYEPACYLCPGNRVFRGAETPITPACSCSTTTSVRRPRKRHASSSRPSGSTGTGRRAACARRVLHAAARSDARRASAGANQSRACLRTLQEQYRDLAARPEVEHVLMFENKGEVVGVSNPHPHCQIYATNFVFKTIEIEADASAAHLGPSTDARCFRTSFRAEEEDGRRILVAQRAARCHSSLFRAISVRDVSSRRAQRTRALPISTAPSSRAFATCFAKHSSDWRISGGCRSRT